MPEGSPASFHSRYKPVDWFWFSKYRCAIKVFPLVSADFRDCRVDRRLNLHDVIIDIIDIQSYKTLNILTTDANVEDLFFGGAENKVDNKEDEAPKEKSSFENTKRIRIRRYYNRNPNALKNIRCSIF